MQIRHFGVYVKDVKFVGIFLEHLGFTLIYQNTEDVNGKEFKIRKYVNEHLTIELIEDRYAIVNTAHISVDGPVPYIFKKYTTIHYDEPAIPSYDVNFVYIDDGLYFEFVERK